VVELVFLKEKIPGERSAFLAGLGNRHNISSGAKGLGSGSLQDDLVHKVVVPPGLEQRGQLPHHGEVEGVERLWAVQGDHAGGVVPVNQDLILQKKNKNKNKAKTTAVRFSQRAEDLKSQVDISPWKHWPQWEHWPQRDHESRTSKREIPGEMTLLLAKSGPLSYSADCDEARGELRRNQPWNEKKVMGSQ